MWLEIALLHIFKEGLMVHMWGWQRLAKTCHIQGHPLVYGLSQLFWRPAFSQNTFTQCSMFINACHSFLQ